MITRIVRRVNKMPVRSVSTITSKGDLYKYQDSLPSLPIPELNKTLETYLKSVKPLYGEDQKSFAKTKSLLQDFLETDLPKLQQRLSDLKERNWLSKWWDDYAYLEYRDPVSPFVSYFFSHKPLQNKKIESNQLLKASLIIKKIVQFMESIEDETLEPELIKGSPYCMESFKFLFNNCRVPSPGKDKTVLFNGEENRFLIVIYKDQFYKIYHHDIKGDAINEAQIYQQLLQIVSDTTPLDQSPVGILTSANRDVWANDYSELIKSPLNIKNLQEIQLSSFVLCLDSNSPITIEERSRNCWHGNGTNRWFDKPIQMFVCANGASGFLGEHSRMDGTPTLRMNDWLISELNKYDLPLENLNTDISQIDNWSKLIWDITPATKLAISKQIQVFHETVNSLDIKTFQYYGLGKKSIKTFKTSPDAFIQMLIQLGYYKMTGICKPTYESASTRKYYKGRTETCRSVSLESQKFVTNWASLKNDLRMNLFQDAIKSHLNYITLASNGEGCDRHLFGLKQLYEPGEKIHPFYEDPMYSYSSHWYLSTSQLSSNNFNGYGWSPVVPDGFGLAYMINNDFLHINITCFKDNGFGYTSEKLNYYLTELANEIREMFESQLKLKL